jgi:hypothetical protein
MDPSRGQYHYEILRPCLWFAKGDKVEIEKFKLYFTSTAIKSLIDYEYIKIKTN